MLFLSACLLMFIASICLLVTSREKTRKVPEDNSANELPTGLYYKYKKFINSRRMFFFNTFALIFIMMLPYINRDRIVPTSDIRYLCLQLVALAGALVMCRVHGYIAWKGKSILSFIIFTSSLLILFIYVGNIKSIYSGNLAGYKFELFTTQNSITIFDCSSDYFVNNDSAKKMPLEWHCPNQSDLKPFKATNRVLLPSSDSFINSNYYSIVKS